MALLSLQHVLEVTIQDQLHLVLHQDARVTQEFGRLIGHALQVPEHPVRGFLRGLARPCEQLLTLVGKGDLYPVVLFVDANFHGSDPSALKFTSLMGRVSKPRASLTTSIATSCASR